MKKKLALVLGLVLTTAALAGCKSNLPKEEEKQQAPEVQTESQDTEDTAEPADDQADAGDDAAAPEGGLKTGLGVITSLGSSADAADADGNAQIDTTVAAVTLDSEGKIVSCVIDGIQSKMSFSKEGKLTGDKSAAISTKKELGADYGMAAASGIGKEWNEQADAFAAYATGKTVDEVKGIALTEGVPADADLAASVTVRVGDFISVIEKAAANAEDLGAQAGDKLGLGIVTNMSKSKDAADEDGLAEAYSTYTVLTTNGDGVITSCIIDASQGDVNFDKTGKITSDLTASVQTKNEIGSGYGMANVSAIGKEWNEQAGAYASYVTGKTLDEVKGIAVTEGVPSDEDLKASVTIHITDFNAVIEKAVASAQ